MVMTPAIFGLSGLTLTDDERTFFADANPAGYILFGRNIDSDDQIRALTDGLRALSGRDDLPILIDQEGGRVARMKAPTWPDFPSGRVFDEMYARAPSTAMAAARMNARALARMLYDVGITVDCLPVLDVPIEGASDVIGDRALGHNPMQVAALGRAVLDGLQEGGVVGVVKHMPGHGRSTLDTHQALPTVTDDAAELIQDIEPFHTLRDAPMGMTCHVVFTAWDTDNPATLSETVIRDIIRGRIGFDGWLMTDDIDMKALSGSPAENGKRALDAGCDVVLNCWAKMDDMIETAKLCGDMRPESRARMDRAMATIADRSTRDALPELIAQRDQLLAAV